MSLTKTTTNTEPVDIRNLYSRQLAERIQRALNERMYLINRMRISNSEESFYMKGSGKTCYTVEVKEVPQCDCLDFAKRQDICKHILFIYLRILKVNLKTFEFKRKYTTEEIEKMLQNAAPDPSALADETLKKFYDEDKSEVIETESKITRKEIEGECPICYEEFGSEELVWCKTTCGNNIHKDCFDNWMATKLSTPGGKVTCVWCRADWTQVSIPKSNNKKRLAPEYSQPRGYYQRQRLGRDSALNWTVWLPKD
jgi:hypothetical protein